MTRRLFGIVIFLWGMVAGTESMAQTAGSPNHILMTVQSVAISKNDISVDDYEDILSAPAGVDFDSINRTPFGSAPNVKVGSYRAIRLTISDMSWKATWGPNNPSPCDGSTAVADAAGDVDLEGNSVFYFKTPDLGGNTLAFYRSKPPPSGYIGDRDHPFVLAAPIKVTKDAVTYIDLVMGVSHTLTCDQVSLFDRTASGDSATISMGQISGPTSGLMDATGIYYDSTYHEIGVANSSVNRITVYDRTLLQPVSRKPLIGPATRFNQPTGITVYHDPMNAFDDEVLVANRGNDSISIFNRTAAGNSAPIRSVVGSLTGLKSPAAIGLFLYTDPNNPTHPRDSSKDEMVVANGGNNTVTIYNRNAQGNSIPLYSFSPFQVTLTNNRIRLTEEGGLGDVTAVLSVGTYASGADLAREVARALGNATSGGTRFDVNYDTTTKMFSISIAELGTSVVSVNLKWNDVNSTARDLLGFLPVQSGPLVKDGPPNIGDNPISNYTGMNQPCGVSVVYDPVYYDPPRYEVAVANQGNHSVTFYDHTSSGNTPPKYFLKRADLDIDDLTGLDQPCGVYVWTDPADSNHSEIFVTNLGNGTVTVYDRAAVMASSDGNVPFIRRITGIKNPHGIYYDDVNDQIGVTHTGTTAAMPFQPPIYPSSTNTDSALASLATLNGKYNVIIYRVDVQDISGQGQVRPILTAERGRAVFDGYASPWPTFSLTVDTQLRRQIVRQDCPTEPNFSKTQDGFYGVSETGRFHAFIPGYDGSLQGAFVPDGSVFVGTYYDSSNTEFVMYGIRDTDNELPYLTSDGSSTGGESRYAFARYQNFFLSANPTDEFMDYIFGVGMALTDNVNFIGASGDANVVSVINPTGWWNPPLLVGPAFREDFSGLHISTYPYQSHPGGSFDFPFEGLAGAVALDGSSYIFISDTDEKDDNGCPVKFEFGAGLRQVTRRTFDRGSVKGTYFVAGLGDQINPGSSTPFHRVTSAALTFDGVGNVNIAFINNVHGVISVDQNWYTYTVAPAAIPSAGDTQRVVDLVRINVRPDAGPYAAALIGMGGKALLFYPYPNPLGNANPNRLFGLAVLQSQ